MPFGHQLTSATPDAEGIHLTAEGRTLVLTPEPLATTGPLPLQHTADG